MSARVGSVAAGTAWMVGLRWADRAVGVASTLILARLLTPDDFGIVAMATLVVALAEVFTDLGVTVALIQAKSPTKEVYDAAWTIRVLQAASAALVVSVCAPAAVNYFGDDRVDVVLWVMAAGMILASLENIGVVTFQKELRFDREFRFLIEKRLICFLITVASAWYWQSYWALVAGVLVMRAYGVARSYGIHPMRPRFSLSGRDAVLGVSQWMIVRSIGGYLINNIDRLVVGRSGSAAVLGGYTLASEISAMPSTEILAPFNRVFFPALVEARSRAGELRRLFGLAQGLQVLLVFPAATGLALVAPEITEVLLGESWLVAVPFIQILAFGRAVEAVGTSAAYVLLAEGKARESTAPVWVQIVVFAAVAMVMLPSASAEMFALLRVATSAISLILTFHLLFRFVPVIRLLDVVAAVQRPVIGSVLMTLVVLNIEIPDNPAMTLVVKVSVGVVSYVGAVLLMWWLKGAPAGPEGYIRDRVRGLLSR